MVTDAAYPVERAAMLAGLGLLAGLAGATAMLASQKAEMALSGRPPSDTPAETVERVTGATPPDKGAEQALSTGAHLAFGTGLGLGLAALARVPEPARAMVFLAGAWGAGTTLITSLGVSPPPSRWPAAQIATDLAHHAVYAATAAAAFAGLRRLARVQPAD